MTKIVFYFLASFIIVYIVLSLIVWQPIIWLNILLTILLIIGFIDIIQKRQTVRRNYPIIGNIRYLLESIRPEIMQYFVETDIEGRPFNRMFRNLIYQRSKGVTDTRPFGTQVEVYRVGYEWMNHSMFAKETSQFKNNLRVIIGGKDCQKPYSSSVLNISAMSFGSLSKNAVLAFNGGAKIGNFAQNTGEGGISPYHLKNGGDLIWQIGTSYFGCRIGDGNFSETLFKENAALDNVKMIEIKMSQGAKPGHGGILPAKKNTLEIANIRGVEPYTRVASPPSHKAFKTPIELMHFIKKLRDLSSGKPIGIKLCIGKKSDFIAICKAMIKTNIQPDFITIDGGEGGTGAAPVEFTNSIGMPLRDGLAFVYNTLIGFDLKQDIKLIASGKILSGFHIARALALGADLCNSARAMMMAIGCIQALKCNVNTCPTGITTQKKYLYQGINVEDKKVRVANYHKSTLNSLSELLDASSLNSMNDINRHYINRRISMTKIAKYEEIYPYIDKGSLLNPKTIPENYIQHYKKADKLLGI